MGNRKRKELKELFKHTTPTTDVLLLQETKLPEDACLKQARFIEFKSGSSLWNEGSFSARTTRFKGGTGIVLSERMAGIVTGHGVLFPGRAQFVTLQLSPRTHLGILNVYGFSETGPRAMLWNQLANSELPEAQWIVAGDFNNIEQASDKQGGSNKSSISRRELEAWNRMLIRLGGRDAHHVGAFVRRSDKAFTWTNFHNDESRIQSRIDRFYIPLQVENIGGTIEILPTIQNISDHAGVVLHFNNEPRRRRATLAPFNKGLLAQPDHKAALLKTWKSVMNNDSIGSWNQKVVEANHAIRIESEALSKAQRKKWKETYRAQFEDIIAAENDLQQNWDSEEARDRLSEAQVQLHEVRQQKLQFQETSSLSKWSRVGDRCTKEFFEYHAGARRPTPITHMLKGDTLISDQTELEAHILEFYQQLYTMDDQVELNSAAREECFHFVKQTVTEEHNAELLRPVTLEEVTEALKQLPKGKAPGIDAIPAEFYQELWEDIDFDIFNFVSEAISQAHISAELNISKIALLPKSEDRSRIQNFRPISLLNTLYKVIAKIYANRMKPLLHNWILPSQTGFVPNRCILDNIFLAFESVEWSLENKQDLSMLLLDFEKAYDRVSWTFLKQTMGKMGFAETWIQQVMSLNLNASAAIIVNGEQSKTFQLQRSVRQGCPLAPYLFLLTVDVLGQMLQHPESNVKGLRLPDNSTITNQMFVDDTLLLLDGTPDNLDRAIAVIKKFGAASGAKLNLHKSVGVWVAHTPRDWSWGEEEGLKWLQPGEVTRYLGYPFGVQIAQKEKDNKMLSQIRKHLHRWANNKLSLAGRIMVSNQVILSSIWYLASCTDFSSQALKLVRATVRNYIWSGKKESFARARVKWATAVLPIVRDGVKILDPQWQASALLVKLLVRGMTPGYEPWKSLVRYRVSQTRQSRRGKWPSHANWMMNNHHPAKQGSSMWQGVMKAWNTIQSGLEQQPPTCWTEIMRQPLYGNRLLTSEEGIQWGTEARSKMRMWPDKGISALQDIVKSDGQGWKTFQDLHRIRRTRAAPQLYAKLVQSIPWEAAPPPPATVGQWVAQREEGGFQFAYHIQHINPTRAILYKKDPSERLSLIAPNQMPPADAKEIRIIRTMGPKNYVLDCNPPLDDTTEEQTLWIWGNNWVVDLPWDPKEWTWRRLGPLPDTSILNYSTKRGYRVALRQDNNRMPVDTELETEGFDSKARAKFFNRIWHPYIPRKVSALQWLILAEGVPVGAWREKLGLPGHCLLCASQERETLQHAFLECEEIKDAWSYLRKTRVAAGLTPAYTTWREVSRGLMTDPGGPTVEAELQWDTAAAFTLNADTPWDVLRAQLLWAIWRQRVAHAFDDEQFHLGLVLWHAWRNTIYCGIEAYKELFRHKRNEEKRREQITCFQQVWTTNNIFGRLRGEEIKWHLTPHIEFLPQALGAWTATPINTHKLSPSPDPEAEFTARQDFQAQVQTFLDDIGAHWQPPAQNTDEEEADHRNSNNQSQQEESSDVNTRATTRPISRPILQDSTTSECPQVPHAQSNYRRPILGETSGNHTHSLSREETGLGKEETRTSLRILKNDENLDPQTIPPGSARHCRAPTSRPKVRCRHGPRRNKGKSIEVPPPALLQETPAQVSEVTPRAHISPAPLEHACRGEPPHGATSSALPPDNPLEGDKQIKKSQDIPTHLNSKPQSRPKIKCRFGPYRRRDTTLSPSGLQDNYSPIGSPPHTTPVDADARSLDPHPGASRVYIEETETLQTQPTRVTLMPASFEAQFDSRFRGNLDSSHSSAELDEMTSREVEELLLAMRNERQLDRLAAPPGLRRILTQEDCLTLFRATGLPPLGTLWGVYRWATGAGQARYNFEDPDTGNYDFMDAYD